MATTVYARACWHMSIPVLLSRIANWAGFISRAEVDDSVIRALVSPRQQKLNQGNVYADYSGQIDKTLPSIVTRAAGDIGMTIGGIAAFPALDVVRQALPMVLALLKMALVICIPLVLLVGTYDLKTVVTISIVQFALFFVDFWFQLARWLDSTILDALYGWGWNRPHNNVDPLVGMNNTFGDMLLNFVMGSMFIVLPAFWVGALAWRAFGRGQSQIVFQRAQKMLVMLAERGRVRSPKNSGRI
ncbi:conjugal transfer protein TraG N-terminal domain-containing protein [Pectobacterium brasiliense]|uniref:conjugal transfer protein TraG N-terminal domain-containing protein n=1 Tax=Pectobacterium brasiliense TaxID=180957 RepID=UPI003F7D7E04